MRLIKENIKENDSSREGDFAETDSILWLWKKGYEVFKNASCTGLADLVAYKNNEIILIDVKTASFQRHKKEGNNLTKNGGRTKQQKEAEVRLLQYDPFSRDCRFIKHRGLKDLNEKET